MNIYINNVILSNLNPNSAIYCFIKIIKIKRILRNISKSKIQENEVLYNKIYIKI